MVERVHGLMSFHESNSDLSRLNREAARHAVTVHPWTWRVLAAACALHRASDGAFDCSVAGLLVRAGQLPAPDDQPPPEPGLDALALLPGFRVRFKRPLWLDLGGIAKGFAVDRAVAVLRRAGATQTVVNAGGDLRVFGDVDEVIVVRDPQHPGRMRPLGQLRDGAVATSAPTFSRDRDGTGWSVRDAREGDSPQRYQSVSVIAPTCLRADAMTKVVWLRGLEACREWLVRMRAEAVVT